MPAGDLVTANFQIELRALLMGPGTDFPIASFTGLGLPRAKTQDTDLAHGHGAVGGRDYLGSRLLTARIEVHGTDGDDVAANLALLLTAWAPSSVDIPLHFQWPGFGLSYVMGRPRELAVNTDLMNFGWAEAQGLFVALDPTITPVPED